MRKALIVIQDNQFTDTQIALLEKTVRKHYQHYVSQEKLMVIWNRIPSGQAFTNYQPSRSSVVTMECANGFAQKQRIALLEALEKDWRAISEQHPDEIMLALVEESLFATTFRSSQTRLTFFGRLAFMAKVLRTAVAAKIKGLPIVINPNM